MKKKNIIIIGILSLLLISATIGVTCLFRNKTIEKEETPTNKTETTNQNPETSNPEGKVTMYIFHGKECPTCQRTLEYFQDAINDYDYLDIELFEVWHSSENQKLISEVEQELDLSIDYIPFIFIGAKYHESGFNEETLKEEITKAHEDSNYEDIIKPILNKTDVKYEQEQLQSS